MYKAVLFDMDGLIIDTEKHYQKAWIQAAKELGFNMTAKEQLYFRSCTKKYAEPIMQKFFGPDFDYDKVRNRRKEIMNEDLKKFGIEKKPYVDEILDFLKEAQLDRVGCFKFSPVEGAPATEMADQVPEDIKEKVKEAKP